MSLTRRPPKLATRLLEACLAPGRSRDGLLGDMEERYQLRVVQTPIRATTRYWLDALSSIARYGVEWARNRDSWNGMGTMTGMLHDVRFALRSWRRRPGATAVLIGTLALGVGANSAVYSVVHPLLVAPLPYPTGDRLVLADQQDPETGFRSSLSVPLYDDWRERNTAFDLMAMERPGSYRADGGRGTEVLEGRLVYGDYFEAFGIEPLLGVLPSAEELGPGAADIAVLAHGTWMSRFGGRADAIGRSIRLNDQSFEVVGVLPAGFSLEESVAFYLPMGRLSDQPAWTDRDTSFGGWVVARLRPGVDLAQARADMERLTLELRSVHGAATPGAALFSMRDWHVGDVQRAVVFLMLGVLLVLFVACANVTSLLLSRAEERRYEFAVRTSVGAGGGRLVRQLITESVVLGVIGGIVALGLARVALELLLGPVSPTLPPAFLDRVGIDPAVIAVTLALSIGASVVVGLVPARSARSASATGLKRSRPRSVRVRGTLVAAQVALSCVLLVCTGLLIRSVDNLVQVDAGFDSSGVLVQRVAVPRASYPSRLEAHRVHQAIREQVAALPGVEHAALSNLYPLSGTNWEMLFRQPTTWPAERGESVLYTAASPDYFDVFSIELVRGRRFTATDDADAAPVVIIDETAAARYWPGEDPLGRQVAVDDVPVDGEFLPLWRTVVGVVRHVRNYELSSPSRIEAYVPLQQSPACCGTAWLTVRTSGDPAALAPAVRRVIHGTDPDIAAYRVNTMADVVASETAIHRAVRELFVLFGALALALGAIGIAGIVASMVTRGKRDIAVRVALGAAPSAEVRAVASRSLRWVLGGGLAGLGLAVLAGSALGSLLYEVDPFDGAVLATVALVLALTGVAAAWIPARRAAHIDPAGVLKE